MDSLFLMLCGADAKRMSVEKANLEIIEELRRIEANGGKVAKNPVNLQEGQLAAQSPMANMFSCGDDRGMPQMQGAEFFAEAKALGLRNLLEAQGGIVQVTNVFQEAAAERALQTLMALPEDAWQDSTYQQDSLVAKHSFGTYMGRAVDFVKKPLLSLAPDHFPTMNAARYGSGGSIAIHNDASSREVLPHDARPPKYPSGMTVYRKVALIYYLTKNWDEAYGGLLIDNLRDGPRIIVPEFNSMVCFLVPREHQVTRVAEGAPTRYSIFGWFNDEVPYKDEDIPPLGSGNHNSVEDSEFEN
mmetsp:Transcript_62315/g.115650  ORF Transcript_62315/g.115650 Transcript_62315/m.115650 type:complete len:301 (-) Transcript_62315:143-1045(-)